MLVLFFMTGLALPGDVLVDIAAFLGEGAAFVLTLALTLTLLWFGRGEQ